MVYCQSSIDSLADQPEACGGSVVVQDVDAPVFSHGGIDPGLGLFMITQVHGCRAVQGKTLGLHQRCSLLVTFGIEIATDHNRPFTGKT